MLEMYRLASSDLPRQRCMKKVLFSATLPDLAASTDNHEELRSLALFLHVLESGRPGPGGSGAGPSLEKLGRPGFTGQIYF